MKKILIYGRKRAALKIFLKKREISLFIWLAPKNPENQISMNRQRLFMVSGIAMQFTTSSPFLTK